MSDALKNEKGVALIVALLVVALATVLIAALLDRGELAAARTRNTLREMQAESYAKGLEDYAAHVLNQDSLQNSIDTVDDIWAIPLPPTPVPGGEILATMTDLNGRFNLNNLSSDPLNPYQLNWITTFDRLLVALKLDPGLERNIVDWMSNDSSPSDAWYASQAVPYRRGQRIFSHLSELRLVKGFDGDTYAKILPYVSALPVNTTINVNTASVPVLMTMVEGMTEETAAAIWQQGHAHFDQVGDIQQQPPIQFPNLYSTQSNYFLARCDVTLDGLPFTFYSLIERSTGTSASASKGIRVLLRNRGGD
ncbi:MAG TPA: type II secretion system minor pseudopilin GspK [Rudaea sp.]|nr:type II secretion system minor pseudopilin GspK [Rudaea sp.]